MIGLLIIEQCYNHLRGKKITHSVKPLKLFFFLSEKNKTVKLREKEKEKKSIMDNLKEVNGYLSNIM